MSHSQKLVLLAVDTILCSTMYNARIWNVSSTLIDGQWLSYMYRCLQDISQSHTHTHTHIAACTFNTHTHTHIYTQENIVKDKETHVLTSAHIHMTQHKSMYTTLMVPRVFPQTTRQIHLISQTCKGSTQQPTYFHLWVAEYR